jgi:hypothetical protein
MPSLVCSFLGLFERRPAKERLSKVLVRDEARQSTPTEAARSMHCRALPLCTHDQDTTVPTVDF